MKNKALAIALALMFTPVHADEPAYRLSCEGFVTVDFYDNGDLTINGVNYPIVSADNSGTLTYENDVELVGEVDRTEMAFIIDNAVLHYEGRARECHVTWQ